MESPEPVRAHRKLEKLAGHFAGPERMHPSYWNDENIKAEAVTDSQVALDGFAVVQDYEQQLDDGSRFAGHGVFRYDMPSDTYELHWFDSTGGPARIFRGGFEGRLLVLTARVGDGWQRLTYDFNLRKGYRFKLETSDDGQRWNVALEGENFESTPKRRRTDARRKAASSKAGAKKSASVKKSAAGKKTTRKVGTTKATATKAAGKKKTPTRKTASNKAAPKKKASARKKRSVTKASAKKASAKKASTRKASAKKTSKKKAAAKKSSAQTAAAGKSSAGKASSKKAAAGKKSAPKKKSVAKVSAKKASARKAPRVSDMERRRRQGTASKKISTRKGDHRPESEAAPPAKVSQQKRKAGAQYGPRMPNLKKTSTRVGWRKTAAKGKREN